MKRDTYASGVVLVGAGMTLGLVAVFFLVPTDALQGPAQRIFYVHAPSAWIGMLAYSVVFGASIAYLRTGNPRWDSLAHSSAEVGVVFTALALVTGMLWGRPVWGAFWVWDPRLTLTLVLFLIYLGYLTFRATATDPTRGSRVAAVIGIAGFAAVPLIHFSVDWWRGQHPGRTVLTAKAASNMPASMLGAVLLMTIVFTAMFGLLVILRMRLGRLQDEVAKLEAA
jgi:heme exporter protein C